MKTKLQEKFENLSKEAQETISGMVEHCIHRELCMGMDGGYKKNSLGNKKKKFRVEIETFCDFPY